MEHYKRLKSIGKGTYGEAHLVQYLQDDRYYVMKKIDLSRLTTKQRIQAEREVSILSQLHHPYIIHYKESFIHDNSLCIVTSYAEQGDLYHFLKRRHGKHVPEKYIMTWFTQVVEALKYLHERHILHRDLKPQNIFLTKDMKIQLGDFGISKWLEQPLDHAKTAVGTPYYLSPEICTRQPYDHKSDIWALGCTLYEMTCLRHAFTGKSMSALFSKILLGNYDPVPSQYSLDLTELLRCLLQVDPNRRPSLDDILDTDIVKKYRKDYRGLYLPQAQLSDELKLNGRTFPLRTSNADSPHLMIERARIILEKECGHLLKDYYESIALHLHHSYPLPSKIPMDFAHGIALLITSETINYNRP